ncbi:unnamed protein product, partial [Effrenium voratum]
EDMLLDIKDRFQQRLDQRGVALEWLWMDLALERQMRTLLDPPALPSAMILRGGSQPKVAMVIHREEDDEFVPATEDDIVLLMNTLLGDELRFQRLSAKKLEMSWSVRRS